MDRILQRLDTNAPTRIIDARTHQVITDFSKPVPDAVMDRGTEKKFAPLAYTMGVINSGLLAATKATGDKRFADFTARQFQFYADHLPALSAWPSDDERRNPFRDLLQPYSLDSCGAMGTSMIQARLMGVGPNMKTVIDRWANYVHTQQFRLADGTLARNYPFPESVWLDDAYMGIPILAEMGKLSGDHAYTDDAIKQAKLFYKHLFVPSANLFTHACHMGDVTDQPHYFWGRANGWYIMALVTLLDTLPPNHPARPELIDILRQHAKGLASCQSGAGLWHQMLNRPDSFLETSCTAMFVYSLAKAVNNGWLDPEIYGPVAISGWDGLSTRVTSDGRVEGVCVGTGYAADYVFYYHRLSTDDAHGYGPTLLAGSEMIRLMQNPKLWIYGGGGKAIMVIQRTEQSN